MYSTDTHTYISLRIKTRKHLYLFICTVWFCISEGKYRCATYILIRFMVSLLTKLFSFSQNYSAYKHHTWIWFSEYIWKAQVCKYFFSDTKHKYKHDNKHEITCELIQSTVECRLVLCNMPAYLYFENSHNGW